MQNKVFISYSRKETRHLNTIKRVIEGQGFTAWFDTQNIPPGANFEDVINRSIRDSFCVIALLSKAALSSEWVQKEVEFALDEGLPIIPILRDLRHDEVKKSPWAKRLASFNYLNFSQKLGSNAQISLQQALQSARRRSENRSKIAAFVNFKGGVGKSTLCATFAHFITDPKESILGETEGRNVLLIDLDPQQNLSDVFVKPENIRSCQELCKTSLALFEPRRLLVEAAELDPYDIDTRLVHPLLSASEYRTSLCVSADNQNQLGRELDIIIGDPRLMKFSRTDFHTQKTLVSQFQYAMSCLKRYYDLILIDCGPSASLLNECSIGLSDLIIAPVRPDQSARQGLRLMKEAADRLYDTRIEDKIWVVFNFVSTDADRDFIAELKLKPSEDLMFVRGKVSECTIPTSPKYIGIDNTLKMALQNSTESAFGAAAAGPLRALAEDLKKRLEG